MLAKLDDFRVDLVGRRRLYVSKWATHKNAEH